MDLTLIISIISICFCIATFVRSLLKDAKNDTKENSSKETHIEVFRTEMSYIKDSIKDIKDDLKEIKRLNSVYKEEMRTISSDVSYQIINEKMQEHIEKYHTSK